MYRLLVVIVSFVALLTAQQQSIKYLSQMLTVEVENTVIGSAAEWDKYVNESTHIGKTYVQIQQLKKWKCYQGGFKVSESDFFSIAGLHPQAQAAKSLANTKTTLDIVGIGSFVVGFGVCALASDGFSKTVEEMESGKEALVYGGFGMVCVGITLGVVRMGLPNKKFPLTFAIEVAVDYNKRLKESLE
jgi:hypothetical protein